MKILFKNNTCKFLRNWRLFLISSTNRTRPVFLIMVGTSSFPARPDGAYRCPTYFVPSCVRALSQRGPIVLLGVPHTLFLAGFELVPCWVRARTQPDKTAITGGRLLTWLPGLTRVPDASDLHTLADCSGIFANTPGKISWRSLDNKKLLRTRDFR